MRSRSIPNHTVPGVGLPPWDRFENFVRAVVKVSKVDADKQSEGSLADRKNEKSTGGSKNKIRL